MHKSVKRAQRLKNRARGLTNREKYDQALEKLEEVFNLLNEALEDATLGADDLADVRSELADSYGMQGGILRRQDKLQEALTTYKRGLILEKQVKDSTYNLSNSIVLSIILGQSPDSPEVRGDLKLIIDKLEKQVHGSRGDEWWAWADLGQFYLLYKDTKRALDCYKEGQEKSGPGEKEYNSSIAVLNTLKESLGESSSLYTGIDDALELLRAAAAKVALVS